MNGKKCAYCGASGVKLTRDHVFPKCLYPASKSKSKVQRITVPACARCNSAFSDDEVQFRNVLLASGEPNPVVRELWRTKALPSLDRADGPRRANDLLELMRRVKTEQGDRYAIYPADHGGVMRVVRKVVRGLCAHHRMMSPVPDGRVWADVLKYRVPQQLLAQTEHYHCEEDIAGYWYSILDEPPVHSGWLLTFFEQCTFIAIVSTDDRFLDGDWPR